MAQILDPIPNNKRDPLLCCYVNATNKIQIARITNIEHWYFERVVFPGQRLVFEALPEALLEIHTGMMASAILSDTIPCTRLQVQEESKSDEESSNQPVEDKKENKQPLEVVESKLSFRAEGLTPALGIC